MNYLINQESFLDSNTNKGVSICVGKNERSGAFRFREFDPVNVVHIKASGRDESDMSLFPSQDNHKLIFRAVAAEKDLLASSQPSIGLNVEIETEKRIITSKKQSGWIDQTGTVDVVGMSQLLELIRRHDRVETEWIPWRQLVPQDDPVQFMQGMDPLVLL